MFTRARITLTGWYVLIIMLISILFSISVYRSSTLELERSLRRQAFRVTPFGLPTIPMDLDIVIFEEAKGHMALELVFVNLGILVTSTVAAYFLSGKTLKPIEAMMEDQKRFVADASHELRTPLTAMKTGIEVFLRDKELKLTEAKELLESNLEEVNKMQSLSNYLLSLSRYQNGFEHLSFETIQVMELINKTTAKMKPLADLKEIKLKAEGGDFKAEVNVTSFGELIALLIDNAIKYSKRKGEITIKATAVKGQAVITVSDRGVGIKASDLPYIFNRFYRADHSRTKTQSDGYGLGLSIAKNITDLHLGNISVESIIDEGSTFTVKIPLKHRKTLSQLTQPILRNIK